MKNSYFQTYDIPYNQTRWIQSSVCLLKEVFFENSSKWNSKVKNISIRDCNCRDKTKCPLNGYCLEKGIYKAIIHCPKGNKDYVGSTGVSFKSSFNQHKYNLNSDKGNQTTLSKFYKANRKDISQIKWSILHKTKEYISEKSDDSSICNLEKWPLLKWIGKNP